MASTAHTVENACRVVRADLDARQEDARTLKERCERAFAYCDNYEHRADAEALEVLDPLLQRAPDAGDVLFERAENLHALGGEDRLAKAMVIYRRLGRAEPGTAARRWWWSQLRMMRHSSSAARCKYRSAWGGLRSTTQ